MPCGKENAEAKTLVHLEELDVDPSEGRFDALSGGCYWSKERPHAFNRNELDYSSGHSPPIFVQLPKADRFCGRLEAISRKFPHAHAPL